LFDQRLDGIAFPASCSFPKRRVVSRLRAVPAGGLVSFDITAHGTVLVTIPLRPCTRPASANAAGVPASTP
jgi:hypothetical protein